MKKTGLILKEAREAKGISIYEVSTATKINIKNILAMEEGAVEKLPPKTFLRGFVASYATYLQLDTASILKTFFEEMGSTRPEIEVREQYQVDPSKAAEKASGKGRDEKSILTELTDHKKINYFKIAGIVGMLILILIIGLIKRKMDSYESESVNQTQAPAASPTPAPIEVTASPTPAATVAIATPTATPVATPTPTPTPAPTSTPTPTPTPAPTSTPKPTPSPASSPKASPSPSPSPTGKAQEVIIEALNDVDVSMQIDSEPEKKLTLNHDEVQSIKARRKVSLKFSDGGAVNLTINGKDRGVPGDLGKPKKVDLP